ncbi:threonylcarbamoyladenosine tRNA methylthiotransferase MtaB [Lachnospiraceae bacterium PF1-4]|nr:tRNA (N(6)-L-threonylcarbamoyladenosine(37)-C(2))-methylthiotransferase MtaB [Ohessyouella blattaphilus]
MIKKIALHNLGCKVNAYETQAMEELLLGAGYEIVPFKEGADAYIINTCTVTSVADKKSRQMLHKARKWNPNAVVIAAGCYTETLDREVDPVIDIIIGNNKKQELLQILAAYEESDKELMVARAGINQTTKYEELSLGVASEHTRAFIKVQDGCNQFCSYCIIPYARGRVRSRALPQVVKEVENLAKAGYKEVVLTGIHLSSYGLGTEDNLLTLIRQVHQVEGIERIRLGSLEPRIITEEFARALAALPKFCPHFHLSLQSGADATLKRMNRRYSANEYRESVTLLRKYFDYPALTTDVIVGFPGETEEEFQESYDFIAEMNFYETHVFKYSKREGTKAASMAGQVPEPVKTLRSGRLLELCKINKKAFEERLIGTTQEVLIEETVLRDGKSLQIGHTKEYIKVGEELPEDCTNQFVNIDIRNCLQIID